MSERFEPNGYFSLTDTPRRMNGAVTEHVLTHNDQFTYVHAKMPAGYDSGMERRGQRSTCVLLKGRTTVTIDTAGKTHTEELLSSDGWFQPMSAGVRILVHEATEILVASSPVVTLPPEEASEVHPWIPTANFFTLNPNNTRLERAYRVEKPWGGEDWMTVLEDGYVLKRIWMKAGKQCSLQQHRFKTETNYLVKGKAKLLLADTVDALESTSRLVGPGEGWYVPILKIHRIISQDDYTAFEISTPHVKDVVRLADDSGRSSGHLDQEHLINTGRT